MPSFVLKPVTAYSLKTIFYKTVSALRFGSQFTIQACLFLNRNICATACLRGLHAVQHWNKGSVAPAGLVSCVFIPWWFTCKVKTHSCCYYSDIIRNRNYRGNRCAGPYPASIQWLIRYCWTEVCESPSVKMVEFPRLHFKDVADTHEASSNSLLENIKKWTGNDLTSSSSSGGDAFWKVIPLEMAGLNGACVLEVMKRNHSKFIFLIHFNTSLFSIFTE